MTNQNNAAQAADEAVRRVLNGYAESYDMMARVAQSEGRDASVGVHAVAYDIRANMIAGVIDALSKLRAEGVPYCYALETRGPHGDAGDVLLDIEYNRTDNFSGGRTGGKPLFEHPAPVASAPADERALTAQQRKEFIRRASFISEGDHDTRAAFVDEIARAALASAPVTDERELRAAAQATCDALKNVARFTVESLDDRDALVVASIRLRAALASAPVADERVAQEYGSPADVAQRIEQYLAQDGRMNSGTQLLYEAMKALRASQGDRNGG